MHNTALEGSTGMNEIKTEKRNFYLRFSDWMDGALWRRALVLLALSSAVITVFSVYTTPISPYYGNDSAFFLLMGKGVTQGKIPYLDLYDQKGPMIFYVNALGYLLTGNRYGIFLMQIVNLTAAYLIVYRLARFWLRSGASLAVVAAYLFVYVGTVQDGNMTEEWSQLFLLLPMYLSLRFLKSGASVSEHPKWYSFVYGVCFGVLLMFRVTNAAPVGGLILAYIILFCREKKVGQLFLHAAIVLFGTALVVVPFCLYFLRVGAFDLFIYASITHNFFYATGGATARDAVGWLSIIGSVLFVPCFFAAYRPLTRCGTLDGRTYTLIGCYAAVGAVTMAFGFTYRHYFLNLAPAVVVILAVGIDWVQRTAPENRAKPAVFSPRRCCCASFPSPRRSSGSAARWSISPVCISLTSSRRAARRSPRPFPPTATACGATMCSRRTISMPISSPASGTLPSNDGWRIPTRRSRPRSMKCWRPIRPSGSSFIRKIPKWQRSFSRSAIRQSRVRSI